MFVKIKESPFGPLFLAGRADGTLCRISFLAQTTEAALRTELEDRGLTLNPDQGALSEVETQLEAYFQKERSSFELALDPWGTPFQKAVWRRLQAIPYGTCSTYGVLAAALDNPGAARAVGMANNRNPIPIVIPCHRVIGEKGKLIGFGGGIAVKHQLLVHEGYFLL